MPIYVTMGVLEGIQRLLRNAARSYIPGGRGGIY
jgi:hypothetical protein